MSISCECIEKLSICCPCKLNVISYIAGWLGLVLRVVLVGLISATISNLTNDDPSIYSIFFGTFLSYFLASFVVNGVFLYGIFIEKRHYLLPYITIVVFELCVGVILASGMCMLLFAIGAVTAGIYVLFFAILIVGVHFVLWLYTILFYKDLEMEALLRNGKINDIILTRINSTEGFL